MARIKGIGILSVVKALRIQRDQAVGLLSKNLCSYLDRHISINEWYPEDEGFELLRALAELSPEPGDDVWEAFGRQRAEIDLMEISPSPIERGDPWGTLARIDLIWRTFHDNGRAVVARLGTYRARIELHDYMFNGHEFSRLMRGYIDRALRLSGASVVDVRVLEPGSPAAPARLVAEWKVSTEEPGT